MKVSVINSKRIQNIILPDKVEGTYWVTEDDKNGIKKNLISIEANNNKWMLVSNKDVCYVNKDIVVPCVVLEKNHFYTIKNNLSNSLMYIHCSDTVMEYEEYYINDYLDTGIMVGSNASSLIRYNFLNDVNCIIKKENDGIYVFDENSSFGVFVNGFRILKKKKLMCGDVIFLNGLRMIYLYQYIGQNKYLPTLCISLLDNLEIKLKKVDGMVNNVVDFDEAVDDFDIPIYNENDYFHRIPRFPLKIIPLNLEIDPPPSKPNSNDRPLLLTMGPMLTMSLSSMITGYTAINNIIKGNATFKDSIPSLLICGAMLGTVFVWPLFTKQYEKIERKKYEQKRETLYIEYLEQKKQQIYNAIKEQSSILLNNYPSAEECENIILNKYFTIWQKRLFDEDFLEVSLGRGSYPMKINTKSFEEHFTMEDDALKQLAMDVNNEPKMLVNVPVVFSFVDYSVCGIIGKITDIIEYTKKLLIQILAFHGYDNLKIVILTNDENQGYWNVFKSLPHLFSNNRDIRFYAIDTDEYKEVCYYLDKKYNNIIEKFGNNEINNKDLEENYLIITDSYRKVKSFSIFDKIISSEKNCGFKLLILDDKITNLPDRCHNIIQLVNGSGEVYFNSDFKNTINFEIDHSVINYEACVRVLSNLPIEVNNKEDGKLPDKLSFLELYDVGKIEQLSLQNRWKNNNPIMSLQTPIGIGQNGEKINIDLHEKFHGPHGLIAGMTGSGKSELIITFILSMAVNYHPYEVQFILIDYKGGGLAGAFENKSIGLKLPHLVGTITNLDVNEIKRSLASIESELRRRQNLFNQARELLGESTIDIYKYQKMYRDGQISEPVSHLFIICDEFAELKSQQPDFMDELNSIARIGRSLGVHLILATQKPNGVVDAQIWSNTRFRICLRVQEKADSNEVIKCPDAAFLKKVGRFYFQVGYNEIFLLGQAAWAGGKYIPSESVNKIIDSSIDILDNNGYIVKKYNTSKKRQMTVASNGEELINIVKYISELAKTSNIECRSLWLEKISSDIRILDLIKKYNYQKKNDSIDIVIGEYDVPNMQEQRLLTIPITEKGNILVYGATGSGKENFITTMLYSTMVYYDSNDINYYIIDAGSETLKMFDNSPVVGDIVTSNENEKVDNLYKMISSIIDSRKKLFANYVGGYLNYCANSGKKVPAIVVIINNYESYYELYSQYEDVLNILTRDCAKYGVYFILTVSTPNGVRFKLKQNFSSIYCLQQNNEDDYVTILGNIHKKYPDKKYGRGIIRVDDIYEFQTAFVTDRDNINEFIRDFCNKQVLTNRKPSKIPVLPEEVKFENVSTEFGKDKRYIIGIDKNTLGVSKYNFNKKVVNMVISQDVYNAESFVNMIINQNLLLNDSNLIVINTEEIVINDSLKEHYNYIDSEFDNTFQKLYNLSINPKLISDNKPYICIIVGLNTFKNRLKEANRELFAKLFTNFNNMNNFHFIIVDSINFVKQYEFESWYKLCSDNTSGIWIGPGFNNQFSLKVTKKIDEIKEDIPLEFCFVINKGIPTCVKTLSNINIKVNK